MENLSKTMTKTSGLFPDLNTALRIIKSITFIKKPVLLFMLCLFVITGINAQQTYKVRFELSVDGQSAQQNTITVQMSTYPYSSETKEITAGVAEFSLANGSYTYNIGEGYLYEPFEVASEDKNIVLNWFTLSINVLQPNASIAEGFVYIESMTGGYSSQRIELASASGTASAIVPAGEYEYRIWVRSLGSYNYKDVHRTGNVTVADAPVTVDAFYYEVTINAYENNRRVFIFEEGEEDYLVDLDLYERNFASIFLPEGKYEYTITKSYSCPEISGNFEVAGGSLNVDPGYKKIEFEVTTENNEPIFNPKIAVYKTSGDDAPVISGTAPVAFYLPEGNFVYTVETNRTSDYFPFAADADKTVTAKLPGYYPITFRTDNNSAFGYIQIQDVAKQYQYYANDASSLVVNLANGNYTYNIGNYAGEFIVSGAAQTIIIPMSSMVEVKFTAEEQMLGDYIYFSIYNDNGARIDSRSISSTSPACTFSLPPGGYSYEASNYGNFPIATDRFTVTGTPIEIELKGFYPVTFNNVGEYDYLTVFDEAGNPCNNSLLPNGNYTYLVSRNISGQYTDKTKKGSFSVQNAPVTIDVTYDDYRNVTFSVTNNGIRANYPFIRIFDGTETLIEGQLGYNGTGIIGLQDGSYYYVIDEVATGNFVVNGQDLEINVEKSAFATYNVRFNFTFQDNSATYYWGNVEIYDQEGRYLLSEYADRNDKRRYVSVSLPDGTYTYKIKPESSSSYPSFAEQTGEVTVAGENRSIDISLTYNLATDIRIDRTSAVLMTGVKLKLNAQRIPSVDDPVLWSSSNTDVATVDQTGMVTAVATGNATITATTTYSQKSASCEVKVISQNIAVQGVQLDITNLKIKINEKRMLTPVFEPANAVNTNVSWSTDQPGIAQVNQSGEITGIDEGTANIKVTTQDGNYSATCRVEVSRVAVTGVTLSHSALNVVKESVTVLQAIISPDDASNKRVTWTSSSPSVATVSNEGQVTALTAGTTVIKATTSDGGFQASCTVTVVNEIIPITSLSLNKAELKLVKDDSETLIISYQPADATSPEVKWSSSNESVATVSQLGKVTALGYGTTTITVETKDGLFSATCIVQVEEKTTGFEIPEKPLATVYPNPTDGRFTLNFEAVGTYRVIITNLVGMMLSQQVVSGISVQMDISNYPSGIYLLIIDDGQQRSSIKVIKNL